MTSSLAELMRNPLLWRGDQLAPVIDVVASGYAELDEQLPGGGWPQGAMTELLLDRQGIGELRLLLPALQRLHEAGESVVLVSPPHVPYPLAFAATHMDPGRILVIRSAEGDSSWWAVEQILRANAVAAVLFWAPNVDDRRLRRLQLAAQSGKCLGFVFTNTNWQVHASPSPLRLELQAVENQLRVHIRKRRGGRAAEAIAITLPNPAVPMRSQLPTRSPGKLINFRAATRKSSLRFNKSYPVGPAHPRIWNRALNPTDEVRHPPTTRARGSLR